MTSDDSRTKPSSHLAEAAASTRHFAEEEVVPRLRGLLHAYAVWLALAAAIVLVVLAPSGQARLVAGIYGAGLCALFAASASYHRWWGHPRWKPLLRRVDHGVIFVFIAASYTPIGVLVLDWPLELILMLSVWIGAAAGVAMTIVWIDAPRGVLAACYIAVGWVAVIAAPKLLDSLGAAPVILIGLGGVLYSLGALAYATQRPDPWPRTFGFHEVFHTLVIAAAVLHYIAIADVITSRAGG